MPVHELRHRIGYREFVDWNTFLHEEEERNTKSDHYLAQIAAEVRRTNVKSPKLVKLQDFLLKFKQSKALPEKAAKSKAIWAAALNLKI